MLRNAPVAVLVVIALSSWAIPTLEYLAYGEASPLSLATAAMFTVMLVLLPFLMGRRVRHGHAERAQMCRECHALRWPGDLQCGFCLHCGSVRAAVPVAA